MNNLPKAQYFYSKFLRTANLNTVQRGVDTATTKSGMAAGAMGGMNQAHHEEEKFYKGQQEQMQKLRPEDFSDREYHMKQISEHEKAIERHRECLEKLIYPDIID